MSTLEVGKALGRFDRGTQDLDSGNYLSGMSMVATAPLALFDKSGQDQDPAQMINIIINKVKGEQQETSTGNAKEEQDTQDDKEKPNLLEDLKNVVHEGLGLAGGVLNLGTKICGVCAKLCSII